MIIQKKIFGKEDKKQRKKRREIKVILGYLIIKFT